MEDKSDLEYQCYDTEAEAKMHKELDRVLPGLVERRLEPRKSVDPHAVLTPEEFAEVLDEAKAKAGFDTNVKTDPKLFRQRSPEEIAETEKLLREIAEAEKELG